MGFDAAKDPSDPVTPAWPLTPEERAAALIIPHHE